MAETKRTRARAPIGEVREIPDLQKQWRVGGAIEAAEGLTGAYKKRPRPKNAPFTGRLLQPDGRAAEGLSAWLENDGGDLVAGPVLTGTLGEFRFDGVTGARVLVVHGANGSARIPVDTTGIAGAGSFLLPRPLTAVPPTDMEEQGHVTLGEGDCVRAFQSYQGSLDRFRFGCHVRLASASLWPLRKVSKIGGTKGRVAAMLSGLTFTARRAIGAPIDVASHIEDLAEDPSSVPRAATLGLGYVVRFVQQWTPTGLSLGELLHSLPLAPGESHRIVTRERESHLAVRDETHQSEVESAFADTAVDSSALETFRQSLRETQRSSRSFESNSDAWEVGGGFSFFGLISASGGGGGSSSSGNASGTQSTARDLVESASRDFHSNLHAVAGFSRKVNRTDIRSARAGERTAGTVRTVTNHNRTRALTMQWWQVLRNFDVQTDIEDVQLCVHVPMELVQWLPFGQPAVLGAVPPTRSLLIGRYRMLVHHAEVIRRHVSHHAARRQGLERLLELVANPHLRPQGSDPEAEAEEIGLRISVEANWLPVDRATVTLVAWNGRRHGPWTLEPTAPENRVDDANTGAAALAVLRNAREAAGASARERVVDISLPRAVVEAGLARLELGHRYLDHRFDRTAGPLAVAPQQLLAGSLIADQVDGPSVRQINFTAVEGASPIQVLSSVSGPVEGQQTWPLSTHPEPRVLRREDIEKIEALLQHVMAHGMKYSRAVWTSLSPEERVVLLEPYTVGAAPDALWTGGADVPLLECVENRVLGFTGNAMILPFHLPPALVAASGVTTRDIQDGLIDHHRESYQRVVTRVALPTRGALGEAVLGACVSAERIDHTRFWNWPDSPTPEAPALPTELAGLTGIKVFPDTGAVPGNRLKDTGAAAIAAAPTDTALLAALAKVAPGLSVDAQALVKDVLSSAALGTAGSAQSVLASTMSEVDALLQQEDDKALSLADILSSRDALKAEATSLTQEGDAAKRQAAAGKRQAGLSQLMGDPQSFLDLLSATPSADRAGLASKLADGILGGQALSGGEMASLGTALKGLDPSLVTILGAAFGLPIP